MKKFYVLPLFLLVLGITSLPSALRAQGSFQLVTGKAFDSAMVKDSIWKATLSRPRSVMQPS